MGLLQQSTFDFAQDLWRMNLPDIIHEILGTHVIHCFNQYVRYCTQYLPWNWHHRRRM